MFFVSNYFHKFCFHLYFIHIDFEIGCEIIKKSFGTCGITKSDVNKIHCLKEGQPTEETKMLLDKSSGSLKFIARPTDVYEIEVENIENVDDLTDKIIEECEMEILS